MMGFAKKYFGLAAFVAALTVAPSAWAGLGGPIFEIEACVNGQCYGVAAFYESDGQWVNGSFVWTLGQDTPIMSFDEQLQLGTLKANDTFVNFMEDPAVNLSFAVESGSAPGGTLFTIKSALLSFPAIMNAEGRASASFTVSDGIDDDGATLTPTLTGAYLAQYNGFVPGGADFTQLIPQMNAGPMGTFSLAQDYPGGGLYQSIAGSVSDMSTQISFTLSPNDLASGTSVFEIVPEPTSVLLLIAGLVLVRRR